MFISAVRTLPDNVTVKFRWTRHGRLFTIPPDGRLSLSPKPITLKRDLNGDALSFSGLCS